MVMQMVKIVQQVLLMGIWLLVIPAIVGGIVAAGVDKYKRNFPFLWITGQILLWALFQLICVPVILKGVEGTFPQVLNYYLTATAVLMIPAVILTIRNMRDRKKIFHIVSGKDNNKRLYHIMWGIFWILLLFQVIMVGVMTYADGDDAFYVAVSTITEESGSMYLRLPYTGGSTGLDTRHGLAPFPIWIAFLAKVTGMRTVIAAHVAVPMVLIPMTYGIYYLIGRRICGKRHRERLPIFLVFTQLLVLFGDYSFYTAENFMIARTRQGKAALGNIVFPMLIFLLLIILQKIQENQRVEWMWWCLLCSVIIAGCLCSTLSAFLTCLLIAAAGLCAAAVYRKWKLLIPMAICCIPAVCYALLFLKLA